MAIVELVDALQSSQADHWHRVRAPGGYEWWEFDAFDAAQKLRTLFRLHDGFALDPDYAKKYAAYRRRPTVNAPPVPRQYPCVQIAIFENDAIVASETIRFAEGAFQADPKSNALSMGANRIEFGDMQTQVQFQGRDSAVSSELLFRQNSHSLFPQKTTLSFKVDPQQRWILAQPQSSVEGRISFYGRQLQFRGIGCHDHYYSTEPIAPSMRHWLRGRAILPNRALTFHIRTDETSGLDEFVAIAASDAGTSQITETQCICDWNKKTWQGLTYPSAVNFGQALVLRRPRIIDSSPISLQLLFDGYLDGEICKAWGEIVYPTRLHRGLAHCGVMKWLEG